jgi:hypothetical protein
MTKMKMFGGAAAALAALAMAVPAAAQDRHGRGGDRGRHHGHHRDRDKVDAGGLVLGALLVGGIVALTSGEQKRRERLAEKFEADYEAEVPADGGEPVPVEGSAPVPEMPAPYADEFDGLYDTEAATDRCASEAEVVGQNYAKLARVASVTSQTWNGKSWVIKGKLELADGHDDVARRTFSFRCALKAGNAPQVSIPGIGPWA